MTQAGVGIGRPGVDLERRTTRGGDFGRLWSATAASNLSDGLRAAAVPLLAATLTRDPGVLAALYATGQLPWLLFGLLSGAIVDRHDRRSVLLTAQGVRIAVVAALVASLVGGWITVPLLFAAAFVLGVAETFCDNASQALVPDVVARADLEHANGRLEVAFLGGRQFAGPLLAGALFTTAATAVFLLDAALLAVAALCVVALRTRSRPAAAPTTLATDIGTSIRWLWRHVALRTISVVGACINFVIAMAIGILVLYVLEVLDARPFGYGVFLGCYAAGGLAGALWAPAIAARLGRRRAVAGAVALAGLTLLVTGLTSSFVVAAAMQALLAVAGSVWGVVTISLRQALAPPELLGKVIGAHRVLSWGAGAAGALAGGGIASLLGLRGPFLLGALTLALLVLPTARFVRGVEGALGSLR